METKLKMIVSDLFDLPQDQVSDLASPRNIAGWDSIRHVELIMACEQEFGIYLRQQSCRSCPICPASSQLSRRRFRP